MFRTLVIAALPALILTQTVRAQAASSDTSKRSARTADSSATGRALPAVVITATRNPTSTFEVPAPVNYLGSEAVRAAMPNTAADLFRDLAGLDVSGVGTNQVRPSIRGQRGQRILLLEDGIRMNNSRRQQDFGELPALIAPSDIARVEVVRGPSSVLYGTDAIGGVLNIITPGVPTETDRRLHGSASYLYGSADLQRRPALDVEQRLGSFAYRMSGTMRRTNSYAAPRGTYGNVTLDRTQRVNDTGVDDDAFNALASYSLSGTRELSAKYEHYTARDAGFGYVDPSVIGPDEPLIRILYPDQSVGKVSLRYAARALANPFADRLDLTTYGVNNARHLAMNIFVPFGPGTPPGAGLQANSANFTKLATLGLRAEAVKTLGSQRLTYGLDAFRDRSDNTDSSNTTVIGFGPPRPEISTNPQVPNATLSSAGIFVQNELRVGDRTSLVVGARAQDIEARTRPQTGDPITSRDRTVVGTANSVIRLTTGLNLVGSIGRGFRSPNLVERFFDGPTPEGSGYQKSSPNLRPETSVNLDLGVRYRRGPISAEAFAFRNDVHDGIRIAPTGDSVNRLPAFRNVNVDRLRFSGTEFESSMPLGGYVTARGSYTRLRSRNVLDPNNPVGTSYSTKTIGALEYHDQAGRGSLTYLVRRNGKQSDEQIGTNPIGTELPAFTVQTIRGSLSVFDRGGVRGTVRLSLENLANTLYAEAANASFFRPQPGRNLLASWSLDF
ncbi:MAG TPA: TonB-dependent receptor [Gemmatimonadaceae bacterium]